MPPPDADRHRGMTEGLHRYGQTALFPLLPRPQFLEQGQDPVLARRNPQSVPIANALKASDSEVIAGWWARVWIRPLASDGRSDSSERVAGRGEQAGG